MDAETLTGLFLKAAASFGYEEATAELAEFEDLKVKWVRRDDWIHLSVTDYMLALTPEAAYDIADGLFRRITCKGITVPFYDRASEELSSGAFATANQPLFIERHGLAEEPGAWAAYKGLAAKQKVVLPTGMRVFVSPDCTERGGPVPTMRVAIMPRHIADDPDPKVALRWIEDAAVLIGKGHCGWRPDAPDAYVEVE